MTKSAPTKQPLRPETSQASELEERELTALRAENGPLAEGRELAVIARATLAALRRLQPAPEDKQ